ncbi:MAG TPA: class I SAM-dependent methyltransferase [Thermomicrobiales bacterium]|nr:class I SAM-dependent methyltransferase [Thermomicrobiales bacterium]
MFTPDQYQLLDFGEGRKLERFGGVVLDRVCPAAEGAAPLEPASWAKAAARYERTTADRGIWQSSQIVPAALWTISHGPLRLELKLTEFGHLGVFPEQAANWDWIADQVRRAAPQPLKVLNLFGYTGGSTLAAAAAGAEVAHVDAARNTVNWARRNAELSGLAEAPVRWIAEDAILFARRELKRGRQYEAVVLDPPSYGHGPKGEIWKLADDLPELLSLCAELTEADRRFVLLSCHSPGFGPRELQRLMAQAFGENDIETSELSLRDGAGRKLPCGAMARLHRPSR